MRLDRLRHMPLLVGDRDVDDTDPSAVDARLAASHAGGLHDVRVLGGLAAPIVSASPPEDPAPLSLDVDKALQDVLARRRADELPHFEGRIEVRDTLVGFDLIGGFRRRADAVSALWRLERGFSTLQRARADDLPPPWFATPCPVPRFA